MNIKDYTSSIPLSNYKPTRGGYKPEVIVLHITDDSNPKQALSWFQNPTSGVTSHYLIEKTGAIEMCVKPEAKAYHCGIVDSPTAKVYLDKGSINPNLYTIGIECVSSGEDLTSAQNSSLIVLINYLCATYNIPKDRYHIIGHYELDTITRKNDPIASYSVDEVVKNLEVKKMTVQEAINILKENNVIGSPEYWNMSVNVVKNLDQLLINMATKIKG